MTIWITLALLITLPIYVVYRRKNIITLLVTMLPYLVYTVIDVQLECAATNNQSEACVWGYLGYIFALVAGSLLYLITTTIQFLMSKFRQKG